VDGDAFEHHLDSPQGRGHEPPRAAVGTAGGAPCGDLVSVALVLDGERVADAGFEASGCGAAVAAGSAAVALVRGRGLLGAARVGTHEIARELGGLSAGKLHAAELAADALHRALGVAARERAALEPDPERTLVALSGGVDSAVAALLARRAGREVVAVTLELWADEHNDGARSCCSAQAVRGARSLAHGMGIGHLTLDLRAEFRADVVGPYLEDHGAGRTPNPCVRCNGRVRLDALVAFADRLGAAQLATGHYARIADDGDGPLLRVAADAAKDQSYMLCALAPATLARLRFPLGELHKPTVRAIAAEAELPVAGKPDSQDLCFLAGTSRESFLARHGGPRERAGELVDARGRVLGRHRGHHNYTVGQRRGLGLGGGERLYVLATEPRANRVVVGPRAALAAGAIALERVTLARPGARVDRVKLRYRSEAQPCAPLPEAAAGRHAALALELREPAYGVAPGQTACLMDGELIVGWGTIGAGGS